SSIEGIHRFTDDCIYFSKLLGDDLCAHGKLAKQRFEKAFRGPAPGIASCDFSKPEKNGLMPPRESYADWESMFVSAPAAPRGLRVALSSFTSKIRKRRRSRSRWRWPF